MTSEWYQKFYEMRETLFDESPEAASARAFYREIVGGDAIVRLTVALRMQVSEVGQDWDIIVADWERTGEFLDFYETHPLDDDERQCLLELIVASLDEHLRIEGPNDLMTAQVRRHLIETFEAQRHTVEYWAQLGQPDRTPFAVTPLMREVWEHCRTKRGTRRQIGSRSRSHVRHGLSGPAS